MTDTAPAAATAALRPKHRAFVDAYCRCWCAAAAARVAGYTESCARSYASRLLRRADVQAAIAQWKAQPGRSARDLLAPERKLFLDAYWVSWSAYDAALAAGYAESFARGHAYRLLRRADIRAALIERKETAAKNLRAKVRTARLGAALAHAAQASLRDYMVDGSDGEPRLDFARLERDGMTSELRLKVQAHPRAGEDAAVAAGEIATMELTLRNRRAAGRAKPDAAAHAAPPPRKPITNRDRAKAILWIIHMAEQEEAAERAGEPHLAATDPASYRHRAETLRAILARAEEEEGTGAAAAAGAAQSRSL
jgi:phage terminase small subunit